MNQLISGLTKLTVASVLVLSIAACGGAEERKVKYLEKGKAYIADKNYDKARIELKNVLQIDPKDAEAFYLMGQLEEKNKELGKALSNYKKSIELDPQQVAAKIKLAKIYVIAGTSDFVDQASKLLAEAKLVDPDNSEADLIAATIEYKTGSKSEAVLNLEKIVEKDNKLVEGISLLSTIYIVDGKVDKAIDLLTKGVSDNADSIPLRITLAKLLAKNNDLIGAEKYLKESIAIEPENYSLQVALTSFYVSSNQVDKAELVLRDAIKQNDEDAQRYLVLVEMLASRSSIQKAVDELNAAIKNKPDLYELKFAQVNFYKKVGKLDDAKIALQKIIADKSDDLEGVNARVLLAQFLLEEGDEKAAKEYVEKVISEYPNNIDALLIKSKLALVDMDPNSAINGLRTVIKNDPKNTQASLLLAQAHELNNESGLANDELKKAIEANPVNEQAHVNYARYLGSKGRIDEAVAVVDKALTYFKDSYDLMEIKLKIIASQGKQSEVMPLLDMMEQSNVNNAEVNMNKGQYYLAKNNIPQAIEQFEIAYQKSNDKYKPMEFIVKAYFLSDQPGKAIERLEQRLKKEPNDATAYQLLGQVYLAQKKVTEAREKFRMANKFAETWFVPYVSLASTYQVENDYDKAIEIYKQALTKMKNKLPAHMQMASIYERQKKYTDAMALYAQIIKDQPSNKIAANNYASLLLDHGDKTDVTKALELARNFEKIPQPALQDTLAWAYAKSGDNVRAVKILKPVVEKSPNIAIFRYHLGYALFHSGDKEAAKSHLDLAVKSEYQFIGKDNAAELLKNL